MQSHESPPAQPFLATSVRIAEQLVDRERYVIGMLNELTILAGFRGISYFVHDKKEYCTDEQGRVGIPRDAFNTTAEEVDILDGLSHELCAHIFDAVHSPNYVRKLRSFTARGADDTEKQARHAMVNNFTDIVGNLWKARVFPRLGQSQEDVYKRILFQEKDYRGKPRVSQILKKTLRDAMVPSEQAVIDPELQSTYDEIQALITPTLDRRSGGATDDDRYEIWTELVWPKLAELLEQDKQDRANQLEQSLNNMEVTHSKSCCGQDGSHVHQQASSVQDGETTGFAQAFQKAKGEIESIAKNSGADNEKIRQELTGHSFEARQEYVRTLQKYAATLDELEEAYRQFLTKEKVLVKKHRVARDGEEIHPDMLVSGYLASLAGEDRPAMWDSIVRKERYITAPGPFDMWVVSDATSSMKNNSLNILASESTALLGQSFERYNHLTIQLLEDPEELDCSRLSVITFAGTATIEQPLVPFATDRQRLDAFHHVKEAAGNNTIISSGLDAVKDMHEETDPPRRKLVIVVSDGDDNQVSETKKSIQKLLNLGFSVRFLNFSGTRKGYQGEELVASPTELPGIMLGIARSIIDGEKES